jgi:hypothetical protein
MDMHEIKQYLAIAFFFMVTLCFFLAWYFWQRSRHRELMLMIEKGMDPVEHMKRTGQMLRKGAIILLGVGTGSALIMILDSVGFKKINGDAGTLAAFAVCIGIALIISTRSSKN